MYALIVDDEQPNLEGLKLQLIQNCPEVTGIELASSARAAREILNQRKVDVMFLDVNMPNENGFDLLESISDKNFALIFVTAYSDYAVRAFKANAIDYLLKPVDAEELVAAVQKCRGKLVAESSISGLRRDLSPQSWPSRLTLPHQSGFNIIDTSDIVWIAADGNYCMIHLKGGKSILVSKAIREFEFMLNPDEFFRTHKSALIRLECVQEYSSSDGHYAFMNNGQQVPISRRKLDEFMNVIDAFSKRM